MTNSAIDTHTSDEQSILARYCRAETLEHATYDESLFKNTSVFANWIGGGNSFWYARTMTGGKIFRLVDAEQTTNTDAFNHEKLASTLSEVKKGIDVDPENLPINVVTIELEPRTVTFLAFDKQWRYMDDTGACEVMPPVLSGNVSPDGEFAIIRKDHNIGLVDVNDETHRQLTRDGALYYAYGRPPERARLTTKFSELAGDNDVQGIWSPDSRYFFTCRTDEREVKSFPVTEYAPRGESVRPTCTLRKYGLPGDDHIAAYEMVVIDVQEGTVRFADYRAVPDAVMWASLFTGGRAWWSSDSSMAYFVDAGRHLKAARVVKFDVVSGETDVVFEEKSDTYLEFGFEYESTASLMPLPETNELIWWSERSGWAHIYLYDLVTGELKNTITSGDWLVREVLSFDVKRREVYVQIAGREEGRNPYYRGLARVNVDSSEIQIVVSGDHDVIAYKANTMGAMMGAQVSGMNSVSPLGDFAVVTNTRPDRPPVSAVFDRNGEEVMVLETADASTLPKGWVWPEPVQMVGADNFTDIRGVVFKPSNFDPSQQYPVIDIAFTSPFYAAVPHGAFGVDTMTGYFYMSAAALAELGFIVVMIDGRGSAYRSKAFHDHAYGKIECGSELNDHVAGIKQLAETRSYMDLARVGIMDWGGSCGPVYGLLNHGDFYKVGAATSVWDPRLIMQGDIFQGPDADYDSSTMGFAGSNLEGKLLLIQGMLDDFFHPSGMFQLIDDLVTANKDFDLVMLPNGRHAWNSNCYGMRRTWDYMVKHLRGDEPPRGFKLANGSEFAFTDLAG
jgi:dipeptidyl-peptidase 4